MRNIIYAPWSDLANNEAEKKLVEQGRFSILDVQLGGDCNFDCCYCDSPERDKKFLTPISKIKKLIKDEEIKYVFICGLGEPTASSENYSALIEILKTCAETKAQCSIFTNLYLLTDELKEYIEKGILSILFKLDSFEPSEIAKIYGITIEMARTQVKNIYEVAKLANKKNSRVNIGASIVPTKHNRAEIVNIVMKCFDMGIYPLLTDLGHAGNAIVMQEVIALDAAEMSKLKDEVGCALGQEYKIPACPSVISGVHINHKGKVTVDSRSGLSCGWFWADEPVKLEIGDICSESFQVICDKILRYRKEKFPSFLKEVEDNAVSERQVFGGCGGNFALLLERYKKFYCGGVK